MAIDIEKYRLNPEQREQKLREINVGKYRIGSPQNTGWQMKNEIADIGVNKVGILEKAGEITGGIFKGFGKGIISTLTGLSSLGEKASRALLPKAAEEFLGFQEGTTVAEQTVPEEWREPEGGWEKASFTAEKIAEFLVPSSKIATLKGLASSQIGKLGIPGGLKTGLEIGTKGLIEAMATGGIATAQEGKFDNTAKTITIVGGLFGNLGAIGGKLLPKWGQMIQQKVIKPTIKDIRDGFRIENLNKYKVGGSLEQIMAKTQIQINRRVGQLTNLLRNSKNKINLNQVFDETMDDLSRQKFGNFGDLIQIKKVAENLKNEIFEVVDKKGLVDLVNATNIKRGAGTKGAWAFGHFEPDAKATEQVYNVFYSKIKTAIEKATLEGVKQINREISELIPISNAVIRRIPIAQRNNVIDLTSSLGLYGAIFDPKALLVVGALKLSKSEKFGSFLAGLSGFGEKMKARGLFGTYPLIKE